MNGFQSMSFNEKVDVYRQFDEARHEELEKFARDYQSMQIKLAELVADLDDERKSRRSWRQQAEVLQQSVERNRFAVVLIDGDGYLFNRTFYMNSHESGGAQAAHTLYTDVQQHLKANSPASNGDIEVMVILCFNKQVPARALVEADIIQRASQLDEFLWSFTSSRSLFQVIDCGPGKERADSKLRGKVFPHCTPSYVSRQVCYLGTASSSPRSVSDSYQIRTDFTLIMLNASTYS